MLPITFDRRMLATLPSPEEAGERRVLEILDALMEDHIIPYFQTSRGTDIIELARARECFFIHRLEDEEEEIAQSVPSLTDGARLGHRHS